MAAILAQRWLADDDADTAEGVVSRGSPGTTMMRATLLRALREIA